VLIVKDSKSWKNLGYSFPACSLNPMEAAAKAAKLVAASYSDSEDSESQRELSYIAACRPFGLRRLLDSSILFFSLRSFLASDKRLLAYCRQRPGLASALPVAAFLGLGWYQDQRSFRCFLPALASATPLGAQMRAAYREHSSDAFLAAAEHVATLPVGAGSASTDDRLERRDAIQRFLQDRKRSADKLAAQADKAGAGAGAAAALPAGQRRQSSVEEQQQLQFSRSEGGSDGQGWEVQAVDSSSSEPWGMEGSTYEPEDSKGSSSAEAEAPVARGQGRQQAEPGFEPFAAAPTPFDYLFGGSEGAAAGEGSAAPAPAPLLSDRPKRPSFEERRERRERRQASREEDPRLHLR
jgi:hypothetical protein